MSAEAKHVIEVFFGSIQIETLSERDPDGWWTTRSRLVTVDQHGKVASIARWETTARYWQG